MKKIKLLFYFFFIPVLYVSAQHTLKGIIQDETGASMPGVNVKIVAEQKGTVTDLNGAFSLKVPTNKTYQLKASFIGYLDKVFQVQPEKTVKITMEQNSKVLDELVIVGYSTVKKSHLTGAVSSVKGDEVMRTTTTDAATALQGKIAGVSIERNSGKPGAGVSVKIRGVGTLGSTEPLYVVDGVYSGSLTLAPEDIESIEVLKDASAAAIYGAQAANGVVIVTSKKGKKGLPKVDYSGSFGVQIAEGLPQMANGKEYTKYWSTAFKNDGKESNYPTSLLPDSVGIGTNWYNEVYNPAAFTRHNLRISGGGDYLNASMSLNHSNQDGTYVNTGFKDYGASFNANYDRGKWHFGNRLNLSQSNNVGLKDAGQLATLTYSPLALRANADGTFDNGLYDYQKGFDPVYYAQHFSKSWQNQSFSGLVFGAYDIMKGLTIRANFNYGAGISDFIQQDPSVNIPMRADPSISARIETHSKSNNTRSELLLNYNAVLGKHTINAVVGVSRGQNHWESLWIRADGLIDDKLPILSAKSGVMQISPSITDGGTLGYFGQMNYAYNNKYLIGASVRRDGSSKFHSSNRYGTFPSISAGWNVHNEKFFHVPLINELKLRGSYGMLGNSAIAEYMYESAVNIAAQQLNYVVGSDQHLWTGGAQLSYASPGVHWETSTTWNVGLDVTMFNNKLSATAEVYQRTTTGALVAIPLPLYTGSTNSPAQNIGSLQNQGLELTTTYRENSNKFKYSVSGNISFNNDKVLSLGGGDNPQPIYGGYVGNLANGVNITTVGRSIAEFYLVKTDGIFRTQQEIDSYIFTDPLTGATKKTQPMAQIGDIRYVDYNNDGQITDADKQFCGNSAPAFSYSTTFHFEYEGFDLDCFFNGQYGNKVFNYSAREAIAPQNIWSNIQSNLVDNSWSATNTNAKYPRIGLTDANGNGNIFTDRWLEDGSFLRLQNIQLGYSVPKKLLSKLKIDKMRVYLNTTNVFTITNYSMGNPEVGKEVYVNEAYSVLRRGVNSWQYPMFRTFSAGIQLSF